MTQLRLPLLLFAALLCLRDSPAAIAQFRGFPSKQRLIVTAIINPPAETKAKLPPPVAPGMNQLESSAPSTRLTSPVLIEKHTAPSGIQIEKHTPAAVSAPKIESAPAPAPDPDPDPDPAAQRKARIKAERERLNRNAVAWQQERAAGGSATAQRSLAMRYFIGDGLPKDEVKGMDLLRKAAAGGDSAAKKELAKREPAKKE